MATGKRTEYAQQYYLEHREDALRRSRERYAANREEILAGRKRAYVRPGSYPATMVDRARQRARRLGVAFEITIDDIVIPEKCPVFDTPLRRNLGGKGASPDSPSLDRIDARQGYVRGNVQVISMRANWMKGNATPAQLIQFSQWIDETYREASDG